MPIVICRACKSYAGKAINYVTDPKKAERVATHALDETKSLSKQFINTAQMHGKGEDFDERKYYHIKINFEPKDRIENGGALDAELAEKIATEFLQERYSQNEYVLAVHTDKKHIHVHAIINAVNFEDGRKIQHKNRDLSQMKDRINDISREYGVSRFDWKKAVKEKREKLPKEPKALTQAEKHIKEKYGEEWTAHSWKETLRQKIDEAKVCCSNRAELQNYLFENYGIEMPRNTAKTISFKHPAVDVSVRGGKLGADYTAESIDNALQMNFERGITYAGLQSTEERADSEGAVAEIERAEQNGVGKLSTETDFGGVHRTIRDIEKGAKRFSATGNDSIREYAEHYKRNQDRQRATEQKPKPRNRGYDIER